MLTNIYRYYSTLKIYLIRRSFLSKVKSLSPLKVYYGCGNIRQENYVNVDIRWTPAVDLLGDLNFCRKHLISSCDEVFLSHVLEHFGFPGKFYSKRKATVAGALVDVYDILKIGGEIRVAVPDLHSIAQLYLEKDFPLYPRLLGRMYGEQDYPENVHKCGFDKNFLTMCLENAGFTNVREWIPGESGLKVDGSFDEISGIRTSLNLIAKK